MREELIDRKVPIAKPSNTVGLILGILAKDRWDDIETVYVVSDKDELIGMVSIHNLLIADRNEVIEKVMDRVKLKVSPDTNQERLVIEAIHKDVSSVPVVDHVNHLVGAVTADKIVDILHEEHLEDLLRSSGILGKGAKILELVNGRLQHVVLARVPWLLVGLGIGLCAAFVISQFEDFLNQNVQLAFFISMIAYMSGAMSTQSETIFIRAITVMKFNIRRYLLREILVGFIIGTIIGTAAGIGSFILFGSLETSFVITFSLLISMSLATVLACLVPLGFRALGKDPAIGSGPFATALQDFLSITIYFLIALLVLRSV